MHLMRQKLVSSRTIFPNGDHWKDYPSWKKGFSSGRGTASCYKLLIDVPWKCSWALGQDAPAPCPSCSSAAPQCCSHAGSASWGHKQREFQGAPTKGWQALRTEEPLLVQPERQTTAAAPALTIEETKNNHTKITTPSLSYWICSCSSSTNIQNFSPLNFIRTFLSPGFCSQFLFHPPAPPCYCFELLGNTYSVKGSSCKSFNSRPPACVERVSRCPLSSRYTLPPGDIRASVVGGHLHGRGEMGGALWDQSCAGTAPARSGGAAEPWHAPEGWCAPFCKKVAASLELLRFWGDISGETKRNKVITCPLSGAASWEHTCLHMPGKGGFLIPLLCWWMPGGVSSKLLRGAAGVKTHLTEQCTQLVQCQQGWVHSRES